MPPGTAPAEPESVHRHSEEGERRLGDQANHDRDPPEVMPTMKLFLDTADIEEIRIAARWGVLDGVTTNPTLYAKVGGSYEEILTEVCRITPGPVSAECVSDAVDGMLEEGRHYATLAPNIVVKVAMSENGLEAISR